MLQCGCPCGTTLTNCGRASKRTRSRWDRLKIREPWQHHAIAWLVGDYLLMPDHLHLFCAPYDGRSTIERWIAYWKDRFAKVHAGAEIGTFQAGGFHHRLRHDESYAVKWQYVRENPVRAGLVDRPEEWPYRGRVHCLI